MARTQAADYDQKRDGITDAAAKLFAIKGFGGTSLSEIAAAAKTSKSLIYHYYPSKEAILYDVVITHIGDLTEVCTVMRQQKGEPTERFRIFARALLSHYVGAADSQKILLYEINNLPQDQHQEIISSQRSIINFAETLLRETQPDIEIDRATTRARIMLFFGMLNWTHTWYKSGGEISRDAIADMASEATLAAVAAPR